MTATPVARRLTVTAGRAATHHVHNVHAAAFDGNTSSQAAPCNTYGMSEMPYNIRTLSHPAYRYAYRALHGCDMPPLYWAIRGSRQRGVPTRSPKALQF